MAPTRILRIFSRLNIGGPSLHVIHLSAGLARCGFETRLIVGRSEEHEGDFLDRAQEHGVHITVVPELGRALRPWNDLSALIKIYRIVREYRPDIVHTHTAKAGVLGRVAAWLARVPIVVHTYHGHVLTGYFHPLVSAFFRGVERVLAPGTDALLTVSESVREDLVRLGVAPAARIRVLPLGLDLQPLAQALPTGALKKEAGWEAETRVVGIVGRLVPIKDVGTFIAAAATVAEKAGDVRFAVVGDGDERGRLEAQARSTRLGERIRFFGWRKDTGAVLGDLDVVVNTSLNEGTPVALIEALAAGRSVVATAVGGSSDVLAAGEFGTLVPSRSPVQTAAAILDALESPETSALRARAGQRAVLERYSLTRLFGDITDLYRGLLTNVGR